MSKQIVSDVPILRASGEVTGADLDAICRASRELDYQPAVVIGDASAGAPAHGYVTNLRRLCDWLLGDIETAHLSIAEALRAKKYSRLAAEVFHELRRGGRKFARALKSVVLHGIPAPEISLLPSGVAEFGGANYEALRVYTLAEESAGEELDRRTRKHMHDKGIKSYSEALAWMMEEDPQLAARYAEGPNTVVKAHVNAADPVDLLVDRAVREYIHQHPGMKYSDALAQVLDARPDLKALYADWIQKRA